MKQAVLLILCAVVLFVLPACGQKKLSLEEVEKAPKKVAEAVNPEDPLQIITKNGAYYIVFQSSKDVSAKLESNGQTAVVQLNEADADSQESLHVYALTIDAEHDTLDIKVNGESASFPMIIIE